MTKVTTCVKYDVIVTEIYIKEVVWGSRSSNDRLAVQTSPKPDGGLSCFAEEVVSQWTRETRTVEMLRLVSVMLASVALS